METEGAEAKETGSAGDLVIQSDVDSVKTESSTSDMNGEDDASSIKSDHVCELCHRGFANKREYVLHQYNHKEKCSYYCAFCFKTFPSEFAFKRHNKFHEKKKTKCISCRICDKEFEYVKDLEEHHRQSHLNEKMFRCKHCQATFSWRENLNKHMRMHEGPPSKPDHKCAKCGRAFMDNISLRLHICDANKKSDVSKPDKPFVCKVCNKAFRFDFSYEAHMNSHEGPVAMNAFRKIHMKALEEKKKKVQEEAVKKLQTKDLTPAKIIQKPMKLDVVPQKLKSDASTALNSDVQNSSDLREIVLEIVNVNELPKPASMEGAQILAEGSEGSATATVPIKDLIPMRTLHKASVTQAPDDIDPIETVSENIQQTSQLEAPSETVMNALNDVENRNCSDDKEIVMDSPGENDSISLSPDKDADSQKDDSLPRDADADDASCKKLVSTVTTTPHTSRRGKKSSKKPPKRPKRPLLYDYVMTEEKPFECPECKMEFRWEISLTIHIQEHIGGVQNTRNTRGRVLKKKLPSGPVTSKIVYRRASSDEEDDYHETDFQYEDVSMNQFQKRKRGRPRKYDNSAASSAPPEKRRRGRPPKDPYRRTSTGNETVVIRVTRGESGRQSSTGKEPGQALPEKTTPQEMNTQDIMCNVHIPKHRLIRFYLLRQLKLSRNRGFFPCRFCSAPFSCKASLNMHILRHTGKGSYTCRYCHQKFPDHRTLVLHQLIEEEGAMKSPHQCSTCFRVCASAHGLARHLRRHLAVVWPSSRPRAKVTE
ncbi:hypothetical protein LSH36_985g01013 [Paralvinella palmiformis]|uniref:C2H2-type domain-containing protein n=1 Tax=Paralvinella palmiformis TaxID=53620 RepID=A0AAD9IY35_9ANNE|nr:hypothetical protein LSH36_985g01013 [Paralvinella palmiformis]